MATSDEILAQLEGYNAEQRTFLDQMFAWATGTVDGGPGGDGLYPITRGGDGLTVLIASPAVRLAQGGGAAPGGSMRIFPVTPTEAYVVAPHVSLGAIALHLIRGNGSDLSTPPVSVGGGFGGWRIFGIRRITSVGADPRVPDEVIYDGLGSQEYAVQINDPANSSLYAGVYHGGIVQFSEQVPDLTTDRMVAGFSLSNNVTLAWPGGQTADIDETVTLNPDGSLTTHTIIVCPHDTGTCFPDMTIAAGDFSRALVGTSKDEIDVEAVGDYNFAPVASVTLRNPSTGTTIKATDNSQTRPSFSKKFIVRQSDRSKIYALFDTPGGGPLGTVDVIRTITLAKTLPDFDDSGPFKWSAAIDGEVGYIVISNPAGITLSGGRLVFTANAGSGFSRAMWKLSNLTPGESYILPVSFEVAGSSPSGGAYIGITPTSNGGGTPLVDKTFGEVGSFLAFTVPAGTTTLYVRVQQVVVAGSTNVLKLISLGELYVGSPEPDPDPEPEPTGPFAWNGAVDGATRYSVISNPAGLSFVANRLVFTRANGSSFTRVVWRMANLKTGETYTLAADYSIEGSSPSAGAFLSVTVNADGSGTPVVHVPFSDVAGRISFTVPVGVDTLYARVQQVTEGGSNNVLRLASLGPIVVGAPPPPVDPDPIFERIVDDFNGSVLPTEYSRVSTNGTNSVVANGEWTIGPSISTAGFDRWTRALRNLTVGATYSLDVDWTGIGGSPVVHGNGYIGVTNQGTANSEPNVIASTLISSLSFPINFIATQETHYLSVTQQGGISGRYLRLQRVVVDAV